MIKAWIVGSIMVLVVILLRCLFLKKLPKQCFRLLWILVAIRLIFPFFFTVDVNVDYVSDRDIKSTVISTNPSDVNVYSDDTEEPHMCFDIESAITFVYLLGMSVCAGSMVYAYIRMRRLAFGALPIHKEYAERWKNIDVRYAEGFDSPFSCGVIRPVIYLPEHMLFLEVKELDMIIAHENRHIKCRDQLVKWLVAAAVCVNWFNPLVWIMMQLANRDIELACDEAVVSEFGGRREYAMMLIKAMETRSSATICSFGAPVLNERIECIMKMKRITVCGFVCATLILGIMTAFFVQISAVKQEPDRIDGAGENLVEAVTDRAVEGDEPAPYNGGGADEDDVVADYVLVCPLYSHDGITGRFGEQVTPFGKVYFNNGVNVAAEEGADVYAAAAGTVITAEYDSKQGNYVVIDHKNGCETVYRHLGQIYCKTGDEVDAKSLIGAVGQTGTVTGPNLGFALIKDGAYISPEELFE